MIIGKCRQHQNTAQLLCLHPECEHRLICLLCEHNHQMFVSVREKLNANLKQFYKKVNESIDQSLKIVQNIQKGGIEKEKQMVVQYYENVKNDIVKFIDLRMNENIALFTNSKSSDLKFLIRSRIQGKYHELPSQLFQKIKQVYQGKDLATLARHEQQQNLQNAYAFMKKFHDECTSLFGKFDIQFKAKIPQIRIKSQQFFNKFQSYEQEFEDVQKPQLTQIVKYCTIQQDITGMISDAYSGKKQVITVGMDKYLRVFDKNLRITHTKQFNNILTRIEPIGDDIFALGVSKQLQIVKISFEDGYDPKSILTLKGHTERIWDISAFNTRIVGTCSEEGAKIWDLYQQKCQYTLRQSVNPSCLKFMSQINSLAVGYHSHELKVFSIQTMKPIRAYALSGVPLCLSQQNQNENLIYCGGFSSDLKLFDTRVNKQVFSHNFKGEAITTFRESIFDQETMILGERNGDVRIFDLRTNNTRLKWNAHDKMTSLSRPNGVVKIYQQSQDEILTVGSNSKNAVIWQIKK